MVSKAKKAPELALGNHLFQGGRIKAMADETSAEIASVRDRFNNSRLTFDSEYANQLSSGNTFGWMLDANRQKYFNELAMARGGLYDWRNNKQERKELSDLIIRSADDPVASAELASYRQFVITSDLLPRFFALSAFQHVNLSPDELPQIITPMARQHFGVRWIGQDGGARQEQWRTTRRALEIEMNAISTDKVEYPLLDLQQGDVNELDKINAQLRWDMEFKIDDFALDHMNEGIVTSGLRDLMTIHPSIDQTNIPDDNYLDLRDVPTYGAAGVLTLARIKAILARMSMWGFDLDPAGAIRLKSMIMSPQHARDSWDYTDLVSGFNNTEDVKNPRDTVPTSVREAIFSGGSMINHAWGYTWRNEYNARIPKGRLYVTTNLPIGWYFTKSWFDRVIEWKNDPDSIETNIGRIMMRKALRFYLVQMWAYRYLVVDFGEE